MDAIAIDHCSIFARTVRSVAYMMVRVMVTNDEVQRMLAMLKPTASHIAQSAAGFYFRKVLSSSSRAMSPIDIRIEGLVPMLIDCLKRKSIPALQLDAAWALTNIAFGSQSDTHLLLEYGIVDALRQLLATSQGELRDQTIWAFGNIAADCIACRDMLRGVGIVEMIVVVLSAELQTQQHSSSITYRPLRTGLWCLANLCRGGIQTISSNEVLNDAIHVASVVLSNRDLSRDDEMHADACWIIAYIAEENTTALQVRR